MTKQGRLALAKVIESGYTDKSVTIPPHAAFYRDFLFSQTKILRFEVTNAYKEMSAKVWVASAIHAHASLEAALRDQVERESREVYTRFKTGHAHTIRFLSVP